MSGNAAGSKREGDRIESPDGSPLAFSSPVLKAREVGDLVEGRAAVQRAKLQARQLLAEARKVREEAYERGYAEGLATGNAEAATRMIGLVASSVEYLGQREREVAAVVIATVNRVLGALDQDELILHAVRRSLAELRNQQSVTVRAAPGNANTLLDGLPHDHAEVGVLNVVADERLSEDECIIETDIGIVNINRNDFIDALKVRIGRRLGLGVEQLDEAVSRLTRRRDPGSSGGDDACPDFSSLELEPLPPA